MTSDFLNFSKKLAMDLITPVPEVGFNGHSRVIFGVFASLVGLMPIRQVKRHQLKIQACHQLYCLYVPLDIFTDYAVAMI